MNDDFVSLFAYNRWADQHILGACRSLTAEQYGADRCPAGGRSGRRLCISPWLPKGGRRVEEGRRIATS